MLQVPHKIVDSAVAIYP